MSNEPTCENERLPGDPHPDPKTQAFFDYIEKLDEAGGQRGSNREMALEEAQTLLEEYLELFFQSR